MLHLSAERVMKAFIVNSYGHSSAENSAGGKPLLPVLSPNTRSGVIPIPPSKYDHEQVIMERWARRSDECVP